MGGQACVYYGAAEFSKDVDFAILANAKNIERLQNALGELEARLIAVPTLELHFLLRGHAVHFRCGRSDVENLRVDVMGKMRGVDAFEQLWERRTTGWHDEEEFELLALPDLVRAKKTQRDKDWPMIRRLVESHFFEFKTEPTNARIHFWLSEARTPSILHAVSTKFLEVPTEREAALLARDGAHELHIDAALKREEEHERKLDRAYWAPLKAELEELRRMRRSGA
ncbi:hypothetical protein IAD21_05098 [Abditibacteriota bacterium]|nr:hypothetical protein IAD21_05098 [Abditibacteriota bacterium]